MPSFIAQRVSRSYTQHLDAPPEDVFPLICPVREKEWLEGWEYQMVYSESGLAEQGCMFKTQLHGQPETIWTITRHDEAEGVVEFWRVTPGVVATILLVKLEPAGEGKALAHVTYTFTGLSEHGNHYIEHHHGEQAFMDMMTWWEKSMNHFLGTGELLTGRPAH
jgi:hypothetical protein